MNDSATPRPYEQWRTVPADRAEDAAYTFAFCLMQHCRTEALKVSDTAKLPATTEEFRDQVAEAVDAALHGLTLLLEGFWRTETGPKHTAEYALAVCVRDANRTTVERIDISPSLLDLPIGYWKWKDGEFR